MHRHQVLHQVINIEFSEHCEQPLESILVHEILEEYSKAYDDVINWRNFFEIFSILMLNYDYWLAQIDLNADFDLVDLRDL